jgi:hypothetical protein
LANWQSITVKFDVFEPLRPPLETALQALETVEALLEAILSVIKPFFLDLSNPLRALVALLLAAVRALINQIRSAGFSVLLVHPDFSQPDFSGVLYSVSGAYPAFESKVVGKFYDTSDEFRPQYPPGSSAAMLVLYVGADSPGDLMSLLFSLLALIRHPINLSGLPAPVGLRVLPVNQSGSAVSQFRQLFDPGLRKALQLEWRMPQSASGLSSRGFAGQAVSLYNQFRFPNFVVERTGPFPQDEGETQLSPQGETVQIPVSTQTLGKGVVDGIVEKYDFPAVGSLVALREQDGSVYKHFPTRIPIQFGADGKAQAGMSQGSSASALAQAGSLLTGIATGRYMFLDEDDSLKPGKTYYYRVRAFFGDATDYVAATAGSLRNPGSPIVFTEGNQRVLRTDPKMNLGRPSPVVKGFVPRKLVDESGNSLSFNAYEDVFRAVQAALLLNFDLPASFPPGSGIQNTTFRNEQRTGWGTLGSVGGQVGALKAAYPRSDQLRNSVVFKATARRLANSCATVLQDTPELVDMLAKMWSGTVEEVVNRIVPESGSTGSRGSSFVANSVVSDVSRKDSSLSNQETWAFVGIVGGITDEVALKIESYLAREETYSDGGELLGPLPLTPVAGAPYVTVEERQALADFVRSALSTVSTQTSYLSWYSLTVGDLFPALVPFVFDFEQFLKSLLKAFESALQEITDIVETLLQKIRALAQIIQTLDDILRILNVSVTVSVLAVSSTSGSAESLVQDLQASEGKPGSSPFGYHSGMVMTFGGPGAGSVAALSALKFILGL